MAVYEITQSNKDSLESIIKSIQPGDEVHIAEAGNYRIPLEYTGVTNDGGDYLDYTSVPADAYCKYYDNVAHKTVNTYESAYWPIVRDYKGQGVKHPYDYMIKSSALPKYARMIRIGTSNSANPEPGVKAFLERRSHKYDHGSFDRNFAVTVAQCFLDKSVFKRKKQIDGTKILNTSGGKVTFLYESRFDKYKDGYVYNDSIGMIEFTRDTIADGMVWGPRGPTRPSSYPDGNYYPYYFGTGISRMDYLGVLPYGAYMPFEEASGIDFAGNGMNAVCGHNHFFTFHDRNQFGSIYIAGYAYATIVVIFDGWYSSPKKLVDCTFTGCRADLVNTEWFEHCTFDGVTTQVTSPNFTNDYSAVVNRCVFRGCKNDRPVVEAPIIANSSFENNECGFPAIGMSLNCAFVDNKPAAGRFSISDSLSGNVTRAFCVNSYLFSNTFSKDGDGSFRSKFFKCVHDDSVTVSEKDVFKEDDPGLKRIDAAAEKSISKFICPHLKAEEFTSSYRNIAIKKQQTSEAACLVTERPAGVTGAVCGIDPSTSFDAFLGRGVLFDDLTYLCDASHSSVGDYVQSYLAVYDSPNFFEDIGNWIDTYFTEATNGILDVDINGTARNSDFISVGPVETDPGWSDTLSCVISRLKTGFGKITPGVQFVKKGSQASASVTCTGSVTGVIVNDTDSALTKNIVVAATSPVVNVDVYSSNDIYVDSAAGVDDENYSRDGSINLPFTSFDPAGFVLCSANTGRYSFDAKYENNEYLNGKYSIGFEDSIPSNEFGQTTVHVTNGVYSINLLDTAAMRKRADTRLEFDESATLNTVLVNDNTNRYAFNKVIDYSGDLLFYGNGAHITGQIHVAPKQKAVFDNFTCHGSFTSEINLTSVNVDMSRNYLNSKYVPAYALRPTSLESAFDSYRYVFNNCRIDCGDNKEHGPVLNGVFMFCDIVPSEKTTFRGRFVYCNIHDQYRGELNEYGVMCSGTSGIALCTNCVITNCARLGGQRRDITAKSSSLDKCFVVYMPASKSTAHVFPAYSTWFRTVTTGESKAGSDMSHDNYYTDLQKQALSGQGLHKYGNINFPVRSVEYVNVQSNLLSSEEARTGPCLYFTNASYEKAASPIDVNWLNLQTYYQYRGLGSEPTWYDLNIGAKMTDCVCDKSEHAQSADRILDVERTRMRTGASSNILGNLSDHYDHDAYFFKCLCAVIYGGYVFNKTGMTKRRSDLFGLVNSFVAKCMLSDAYLRPSIIETVSYVPANDPAVTGGKDLETYLRELKNKYGYSGDAIERLRKSLTEVTKYNVDLSRDMCHIYDKYDNLVVSLNSVLTTTVGKHTYTNVRLSQLLKRSTVYKTSGVQFPAFGSFTYARFNEAFDCVESGEFLEKYTRTARIGNDDLMFFGDEELDSTKTYTFIRLVANTLGRSLDYISFGWNGPTEVGILFPNEKINTRNCLF